MKPKIAPQELQPKSFAFSKESMKQVKYHIAKYPEGRQASAVMPLLDIAQRQEGWISEAAMNEIAVTLDMPPIKVYEVATFYSMYHLAPVGKYHLQLCTTTPCWLCGSGKLKKVIKDKLGIENNGDVSKDGMFSIEEVECLGACVNAPVCQVNDDYYEDLDEDNFVQILDELAKGKVPAKGSMKDRQCSMPEDGTTVLVDQAKKAAIAIKDTSKSTGGKA